MAPPKVLMIAEKPSIALSIASTISGGQMHSRKGTTEVHEFEGMFNGFPAYFKVTSVTGHVFRRFKSSFQRIIWLFLGAKCTGFQAKDDRRKVYRARFSSVTEKDILKAMNCLVEPNEYEALAVDARQEIDLKVGVAFTRFQTSYFQGKYGNLDSRFHASIGILFRSLESLNLEKIWAVSNSYPWVLCTEVALMFQKLVLQDRILEVTDISEKQESKGRPPGLNTVNLLKVYMVDSKAENYDDQTCSFLSYPRTESTAYPSSFDFKGTLGVLANNPMWGDYVQGLLSGGYHKPQSGKDAGDHPPITPMRSANEDMLERDSWRLYQYVCQHFLGTVSPDCKYTRREIYLRGFLFESLMHHYGASAVRLSSRFSLPDNTKGLENIVDLGQTVPPDYLSESELISLMEKNGIGTDASISVHINNICERNYVQVQAGRKLVPTALGITLIRGYQCIDPDLCLPDIRGFIEQQITLVAKGEADHSCVVQHVLEQFKRKFIYFVKQIDNMDALFEAQFSPLADSGRAFSKCGKCLRYMKYISSQPSRLYCGTCEEVYYLPQKGTIKLYKELTCPLDNFELLIFAMAGPEGKSFPLCPLCYNNPPFEGIDALFGASKTGGSGMLGKGAGMPCFLCPHPTCRHSLIAQGVCACPECNGTLVLDPVSAPKWRLYCNMCNCLVLLPQGAHRISTTRERCPECDSTIIEVDFNKNTTPLEDGATLHVGCILCDDLLHSLVEVKHGKSFFKRAGKWARARGRGAYRGRGRGFGKMDPKMSFRDF
ncbi:DNA topoisomerase 3-beta isoform X1 [Populus alba x Populus x berolinensis]|uniref:DNA topoisomerase n=1 Tax=Populus alba x Populus x berolinensis TaxID=444605 RepID=A0AAD6LTV0_9ROSI|nr:DNA topoisomerase 3-beta isoform X1 [Populus alba x Populus x berolinensis]